MWISIVCRISTSFFYNMYGKWKSDAKDLANTQFIMVLSNARLTLNLKDFCTTLHLSLNKSTFYNQSIITIAMLPY